MSKELDRMKKRSQAKVDNAKNILTQATSTLNDHLGQIQSEYHRVADLSHHAPAVIENIDKQFKEKTKLTDSDIAFLMICTALQCARQYLLTNDKFRITAAEGDALMGDTLGLVTPPTWKEVLFEQSVPYDVTKYQNPNLTPGLAGVNHRYQTLGHDPILGWIFGTANIMTNSLTKSDIITTYQVSNGYIIRHYPLGTMGMLNNAAEYAQRDPMLLAASTARQAIHFGSDYFTKQSLPIPFLGTLSPEMAHRFMFPYKDANKRAYIDMWSITRGATLAALINQLIATIHKLFYDEAKDGSESMYEIRTRKILSYSNALAVGSNVVVTAITNNLTKLDVGGILVALHRFISDYQFIQDIKRDFLKNEVYNRIVGKPYDFMEGK